MRIKELLIGDIRFQFKYGFYFVYLLFTCLYVFLLHILPVGLQKKAAIMMIFTDPAAMGLYFMGAIILFEKSERVLNSIAVSPVKPIEYVIAKLVSISFISITVGLIIAVSGRVIDNLLFFVIGIFLGSCLFSSLGIMICAKIASLNQFIVASIPAEIIINIPAIAWLLGWKPAWLIIHPGVSIIELCQNGDKALLATAILMIWMIVSVYYSTQLVKMSFKAMGGFKL